MKPLLAVLLGILVLNLLVIAGVACIVWIDHLRSRRRRKAGVGDGDAHAKLS